MSDKSWLQWRGDSIGMGRMKGSQLQVGRVDVAPDGADAGVGDEEVDALWVRPLDLLRCVLRPHSNTTCFRPLLYHGQHGCALMDTALCVSEGETDKFRRLTS